MTWQRIETRYPNGADPGEGSVLYWDSGRLGSGSLLLWSAPDGQVSGFQLAHAPFPGGREYLADWHLGRTLRLGEVDAGEPDERAGPWVKMSPIVRGSRRSAHSILRELLGYFEQNAAALEPRQRELVSRVLSEAMHPV